MAWAGTAVAEPYLTHTDVELRIGEEYLCGTCHPHNFRTNVQVFADRLFPTKRIGDGVLEIAPTPKGPCLTASMCRKLPEEPSWAIGSTDMKSW